jgi:UDP-glucose:(heptosyl)LPS alpha-1,3-glucosyltransferase
VILSLLVRRLGRMGGTERFVHGLACGLVAAGHTVEIWCDGVDDPVPGATIRHLPFRGRGRLLRLGGLWWAGRRFVQEARGLRLGFVRVGGLDLFRAGGGCHARWRALRGPSAADWAEEALDRRAVGSARRVIVNSEMAGADLRALYGTPAERLRLVRNGVDLDRFRPTVNAGPKPILFFGSGFARKGLDTALRALVGLPGRELWVIGADRQAGRFVRLADALGLGGRVRFLGAVASPETLLPQAGALVLPTRYDPAANVVLEALACGVPVVTSAANGAAELLPEPWMVVREVDHAASYRDALDRLLSEPVWREQARSLAEPWTPQRALAGTLDALMELSR